MKNSSIVSIIILPCDHAYIHSTVVKGNHRRKIFNHKKSKMNNYGFFFAFFDAT